MLNYTDDFEVKSLGIREQDVYDIEVEDNHNFFANDILVHNSIYINLGPLVENVFGTTDISREQGERFIDEVCKAKIEPLIDAGYQQLADNIGCYRNAMKMKREKISDRTIFVAKKKYIMSVLNSEGVHYDEPKISPTGIDAARSSTPDVCKKNFIEAFKLIMSKDEKVTQRFIEQFKEQFFSLRIEDISKVSGTNDIDKWLTPNYDYLKGCPIHVRGCAVMNKWIVENKLENRYPLIQSGDKIKFVYLKLPNPLRENVISFIDQPPKELQLEKYVDRELQFSKVFQDPLCHVLDAVGWSAVEISTLEDFFG